METNVNVKSVEGLNIVFVLSLTSLNSSDG